MFTEAMTTPENSVGPQRWSLTRMAFDRLLSKLGPDRESAGKAYQDLRDRLVTFYQPHARLHAEQWADTVLDRVAKKNEQVEISNINAYIWGVARVVRSEMFRSTRRQVSLDEHDIPQASDRTEEEIDRARRAQWLARFTNQMPRAEFELLLGWYSCYEKAAQRQRLALSLGISVASLRVKAHRARLRLRRLAQEEGF